MSATQPPPNSLDSPGPRTVPMPRTVAVAIVWTAVVGIAAFVWGIIGIVRDLSDPNAWIAGLVASMFIVFLLLPEILTLLVTALLLSRQRAARTLHTVVCCLWMLPILWLSFGAFSHAPLILPLVLVVVVAVILLPAILTWLPASRGYFSRGDKTPIIIAIGLTWVVMGTAVYFGWILIPSHVLDGWADEASNGMAVPTAVGLLLIPAALTIAAAGTLLTGQRWARVIHTATWAYWAGVVILVLPQFFVYARWSLATPIFGLILMAVAVLLTWLPASRPQSQ